MQVELQVVVRDKLVNKQSLRPRCAESNQGDQVLVMYSADYFHLGLELALSLAAPSFKLLHRNLLPIWKDPLVHITETALSEKVRVREAICGHP